MSTIPRCGRNGRARSPVDCTAFRVASVGGCPHIDHRSAVEQMATLTIDIHSKPSRCRWKISTSPDSRPSAATFALTCRIHRLASRFRRAISTRLSAGASFLGSGPVVAARQACVRRARSGCQPRRGLAPAARALAGLRRSSVRIVALPNDVRERVWISPPAHTQKTVNFDGEHRRVRERGHRFWCGQSNPRRLGTLCNRTVSGSIAIEWEHRFRCEQPDSRRLGTL